MAIFTTLHADLDMTAYQSTTASEPLQGILTDLQAMGALNIFKVDMQLHVTETNFQQVQQKVAEMYAAGLFEKSQHDGLMKDIATFTRYYMNKDPK